MMTVTTTSTGTMWNGGVCAICGARFVGSHSCSREDVARRISELLSFLNTLPMRAPLDATQACPCRPENGGSGVCGCTLGGPQVTC